MSRMRRSAPKCWKTDDRAVAAMVEYIMLSGISMMVFIALFMGIFSFKNNMASEGYTAACSKIASAVSGAISDAYHSGGSEVTTVELELPDSVQGMSYIVYPSYDMSYIVVLPCIEGHGGHVTSPLAVGAPLHISGFIVSGSGSHRIMYYSQEGRVELL